MIRTIYFHEIGNSLLGQIHKYYYYQTQTSIHKDVNIIFILQKTKKVVQIDGKLWVP